MGITERAGGHHWVNSAAGMSKTLWKSMQLAGGRQKGHVEKSGEKERIKMEQRR